MQRRVAASASVERGSHPLNAGTLEGWGGFGAWAFVGALFGLSVLGAASIGLFVLPVAVLALIVALWLVRVWPEIVGGLEGLAALLLMVGIGNLGAKPCPSSGSGSVHVGRSTGPGSFSCGGWEPTPWLVVGLAVAGVGFGVFVLARWRAPA